MYGVYNPWYSLQCFFRLESNFELVLWRSVMHLIDGRGVAFLITFYLSFNLILCTVSKSWKLNFNFNTTGLLLPLSSFILHPSSFILLSSFFILPPWSSLRHPSSSTPNQILYLHYTYCIGTAAFIDAEHALDPVYAKNLGVNVDDLLVCQVSVYEEHSSWIILL